MFNDPKIITLLSGSLNVVPYTTVYNFFFMIKSHHDKPHFLYFMVTHSCPPRPLRCVQLFVIKLNYLICMPLMV